MRLHLGISSAVLFLLACGSSSDNDTGGIGPDAGTEADAATDLALLDTGFPELADVRGYSAVLTHGSKIHVIAYQRLRLSEDGTIDSDFEWQSNGRKGLYRLDAMGRPLEVQVDQGTKTWQLVAHQFDGQLDLRFSGDASTPEFDSPANYSHDLYRVDAIETDDGIVVVGNIASRDPAQPDQIWVARVQADGSLDGSFGIDGYVMVAPEEDELLEAEKVVVGTDGKIVIVGNGQVYEPVLVVLKSDGTLDDEFGSGGILKTGLGTRGGNAVAVDTEGRILVGSADRQSPIVKRYLSDGSEDASFQADLSLAVDGVVRNMAWGPHGDLMVVGSINDAWDVYSVFWTRIDEDGALVKGIDEEEIHLRESGYMTSAIDERGRVLVAECTSVGSTFCDDSQLVRLNH